MANKKRSTDESNPYPRRSSRLAHLKTTTSPEEPKTKKPRKSPKAKQPPPPPPPAQQVEKPETGGSGKTIIIEHCKQCNQFKIRAMKVKEGLEKGVEGGVNVVVNPVKPRRGCFEIREENGETYVSLLDMKRPFTLMKELDMDQVISDIIEKIQ